MRQQPVAAMWKRLVMLALLSAASTAAAQSVDSLWGFRGLRSFTDSHRPIVAGTLVVGVVALQGANNGWFWGDTRTGDIHGIQDWQTWGVASLGYVGGLDAAQTAGVSMLANFGFSAALRQQMGRGIIIIDMAEPCQYDTWLMSRRKLFCRETRYVQLAIGLGLVFYRPIYRFIRKRL